MADLVNGWLMSNALDTMAQDMRRRKEEAKQNELRRLAGSAYAAPEGERQERLNALAQQDVGMAFQMEKGLQAREEYTREQIEANRQDILRGIGILETLDPMSAAREFPNIVRTIRDPSIRRVLEGKRFEEVAPMLPQLKQQLMAQMSQGDVPAAFRAKDMQARAAGLMPGTPEYQQFMQAGVTRARPATPKVQFMDDGTAVVLDPNTGTFRQATQADLGGGAAPTAMPDDAAFTDQVGQWGMSAIEQLVQRGIPRAEAEAIVEPMMQQKLEQSRMMTGQQPPAAPTKVGPSKAETAAEVTRAQEEAKAAVDKQTQMPKIRRGLNNARQNNEYVQRAIDQALPNVNVWTSGFVGKPLSVLPGTAAADLRSAIDTIEANMGFDQLEQMRLASPTGGALGSITERELDLLQSRMTSLKNSQSPKQLAENLRFVKQQYKKVLAQMERDFQQDYGGTGASAAPAPAAGVKVYRYDGQGNRIP